jgi:D-alanyl-D-alanine carboxypeptidase
MQRAALAIFVLALLPSCGRKLWQAPDPQDLAADLAAVVDARVADLSGAAVKVQTHKGEWVHTQGSAHRGNDLMPDRDVDRFDRFGLRDITAAYVVTAILILADEGSVRLDDPVSKYVPGVPRGDEITLRHLAGMRSGLSDYTASADLRMRLLNDPARVVSAFELLVAVEQQLRFDPGTAFEYSRTNPLLLGEVLLAVTGRPWHQVIRERMLEPLKLFRTELPLGAQPTEPFAGARDGQTDGRIDYSHFGAAAGLASTIGELTTFGRALAEGAYLSAFMHTERLAWSPRGEGGPLLDRYGLGISELSGMLGHAGEGFGYSAAVFHEPSSDMTIAVLLDASSPILEPDAAARMVVDLAAVLGWPPL